MEIKFNNQLLIDLYEGNKVNDKEFRSNPTLIKQYVKTINKLKAASKIEQLFQFSGLNYEKLKGDRKGLSSVRVNLQYRLIFEEIKNDKEPFEVVLLEIEELSKHYQ
jgi:proteic killer suppression protein